MSAILKSRQTFQPRKFLLRGEKQREALLALVPNLPLDDAHPLEIVVREEVKGRKPDQNAEYWAGPLRDIAEQAYVEGRQFSAEVWHEHFKREYLPEEFDPELCKDGYRKWDFTPAGERVLVGSTTMLTRKGFAIYREQVEAEGASLGVMFHVNPNARFA